MVAGIKDQVVELERKVGRNLLRFQKIEFFLKHALPYMHPDGNKQGDEGFRKYRDTIRSKTLGLLIKELNGCDGMSEDVFSKELATVVDARNDLVHHLFQRPGIDPMSATAVEETIRYLDKQYEQAEELYQFARTQSLAVLLAVMGTNAPDKYPVRGILRSDQSATAA